MQGTAAVVLAAAFSAVRAAGTRMRDQRVVIHGAGTAGLGIADMMRDQMVREGLPHEEATRRFYPLGRSGLLVDDRPEPAATSSSPTPDPAPRSPDWASRRAAASGWPTWSRQVHPTMLIGTSTQAGAFTEAIVRDMAAHTDAADHHAAVQPHLQGRGAAGGPDRLDRRPGARRHRQPVRARRPTTASPTRSRRPTTPWSSPASDSASTVARASRISDRMIAAAADAVAKLSDATRPGAPLLPPVSDLRPVSAAVAIAVARPPPRRAWPRPTSTTRSSRCTRPCGARSTRASRSSPSDRPVPRRKIMPGSVIVGGARTPIGKLSGALKGFTAMDLGGFAIKRRWSGSGISGDQVDYVIMGHVIQAGAGQITARQAAVKGGIPMSVPALTVNKVCLSGLNAIAMADQLIGAGEFDVVVAGRHGVDDQRPVPAARRPRRLPLRGQQDRGLRPRTTPCTARSTCAGWATPPSSTASRRP